MIRRSLIQTASFSTPLVDRSSEQANKRSGEDKSTAKSQTDKKLLEEIPKKPPTEGAERVEASAKSTDSKSSKQEGREPIIGATTADKAPPQQDGELAKEEGKVIREKVTVVKDDSKKTSETTKEKEESRSKLADFALPEFTRVMVTKLSRNVTQVCGLSVVLFNIHSHFLC